MNLVFVSLELLLDFFQCFMSSFGKKSIAKSKTDKLKQSKNDKRDRSTVIVCRKLIEFGTGEHTKEKNNIHHAKRFGFDFRGEHFPRN
jgi:hypothetical protein